MSYREDFSWAEGLSTLTCEVVVRIDDEEITRTIKTDRVNPMGVVQEQLASERGVRLDEVHPVTWRVIENHGVLDPSEVR